MRTPILQFGTSRFLQAHADLFISEAMGKGDALGAITVVQSSGDSSRSARLAALAAPNGFTVRIEGIEGGQPVRLETKVRSIKRALSTEHDWTEIARIAAEEAEIILSNTGDSGWKPQEADTASVFEQTMSFPAKLTHLLYARFSAGGRSITVMPTELVVHNGDILRNRVLEVARKLNPALAYWIEQEVVFVNSLVDRIVSAPLEPAGAVAEPYALWAIEEKANLTMPCRHPAVLLVEKLDRIERLKLHVLNLGHSYMVSSWLSSGGIGAPLVREYMADASLRSDLVSLFEKEVLPVFAMAGYHEAPVYVAATLDRFSNPYLDHHLKDIAQNHAEKMRRRIGQFLEWGVELGCNQPRTRLETALSQSEDIK